MTRLSSLLSTTLLLLSSTANVVSAQQGENFRGNAVAAAASSSSYDDSADECVTSQFISLADDPDAIKLSISTFDGVETDTIDLPQAFQFRGNIAVSQLVVTQHGSIHLDPSQRTAEEGPLPIQASNGNNAAAIVRGPRIQVAQTSFTISNVGKAGVYYKDLGTALLISWEPALVAGGRMLAQFQVSLEYATGNVDMQWKGLGPIGDTIPVSVGIIQDDSSSQQNLVSPATGAPFGNQGVAQYPSVFSQDTCRKFRVVNSSAAAEQDEEPTVVRGRHLR